MNPTLLQAARTLGASEWRVFRRVLFPLAAPGVVAGTVLAFARAMGEFGATLMLAGNIPGRTQTMPIAIFSAVEGGDMRLAAVWVALIVAISLGMIRMLNRQGKAVHKRVQAEVALTAAGDGVEKDCAVNLDSINTIPKDWLADYVCTLSAPRMREVKLAILYALDLR